MTETAPYQRRANPDQEADLLRPGTGGELLAEAIGLLHRCRDPAETLNLLSRLVVSRLEADLVHVWLEQEGTDDGYVLWAQAGETTNRGDGPRTCRHEGQVARILAGRSAQLFPDLLSVALPKNRPWIERERLVSACGVPLFVEEEPVGFLFAFRRTPFPFSKDEVGLLETLTVAAAIAYRDAQLREQERRRTAESEQLAEIVRAVTSTGSLDDTLREVCRRAAALCGGERGTVFLVRPGVGDEPPWVQPAMSDGAPGVAPTRDQQEHWKRFRRRSNLSLDRAILVGRVVRTRAPVVIDRAEGSELIDRRWVEAFGVKSLLAVPLIAGDEVVGALVIDTETEIRPFSEHQVDLALAIADHVSFTLQKALLHDETQHKLELTEAHLAIAGSLNSTLELKPMLSTVAQQAAVACMMDRCSVFLFNQRALEPLISQFRDGREDPSLWGAFKGLTELARDERGFLDQLQALREPRVIEDLSGLPERIKAFGSQAVLIVPLVQKERTIGVMVFDDPKRSEVSPSQVALAATIGSQVGLAVENARLYANSQRHLHETEALLRVAQSLGTCLDSQEVSRRTTRELCRLLGADSAIFFATADEGRELVALSGYRVPKAAEPVELRWPYSDLPDSVRRAYEAGEAIAISDVERQLTLDHPLLRLYRERAKSLLATPVRSQGRLLGAIVTLWWNRRRSFRHEELDLASGVASQMALVLENARNFERAQAALAELQEAQNRLVQSEKSRALAAMAGGVAHDFNNLLTVILGRSQWLAVQHEDDSLTADVLVKGLTVIERAALDGAETVRRLLDFTRERSSLDEAQAVDVNTLLVDTAEVSQHRWQDEAQARGSSIRMVVEQRATREVAGNPSELREVLLNLVFNAIDAMPDGGTITMSSANDEDSVCIQVKDTGTGMPIEVAQRAFDPFFTTKGPASTGLGLSASYGIVNRHGGEIAVDSRPGEGTTFTILLPVADGACAGSAEVVMHKECSRRVLVIDDDEVVLGTVQELLSAKGHEVFAAASGLDGLALLKDQTVDVVLTDLGMPRMTGWEVADRVKERYADLKVVLVTGWGARVEESKVKQHRVDHVVSKPFRARELLDLLATI